MRVFVQCPKCGYVVFAQKQAHSLMELLGDGHRYSCTGCHAKMDVANVFLCWIEQDGEYCSTCHQRFRCYTVADKKP